MIESRFFTNLKNKSILITGGTGFFGKNLINDLIDLNLNENLNLKIITVSRKKIERNGVISIEHDLSNGDDLVIDYPIDYLIHAATPVVNHNSTPDELMKIIIEGTNSILKFAVSQKVSKFLLVSSGAVYGAQPENISKLDEGFTSQTFYESKNPYAFGKRVSELMVQQKLSNSSIDFTIARCFAFSGRFLALDQHLAIGNFVKDLVDNNKIEIKGNGQAIRSYMDNEDLCNWLVGIMLEGKSREIYNLGSDQEINLKDLAYKVASFKKGSEVSILGLKDPQLKANRYIPCIDKAQKELNLKLTISLDSSIQKMIENYRNLK